MILFCFASLAMRSAQEYGYQVEPETDPDFVDEHEEEILEAFFGQNADEHDVPGAVSLNALKFLRYSNSSVIFLLVQRLAYYNVTVTALKSIMSKRLMVTFCNWSISLATRLQWTIVWTKDDPF